MSYEHPYIELQASEIIGSFEIIHPNGWNTDYHHFSGSREEYFALRQGFRTLFGSVHGFRRWTVVFVPDNYIMQKMLPKDWIHSF